VAAQTDLRLPTSSDFITAITAVHRLSPVTAAKAGYHGANAAATAIATAAAASAPVTPPRKATTSNTTTILEADNPGKPLTVFYCSMHGVQTANAAKRGGTTHSNNECPDKATNKRWVDGATLLDCRGGSDRFVLRRQHQPKDK
jgi:Na+-translocating ferredoxin:NAD+ oxidoreductase RNF subunit RnfB